MQRYFLVILCEAGLLSIVAAMFHRHMTAY